MMMGALQVEMNFQPPWPRISMMEGLEQELPGSGLATMDLTAPDAAKKLEVTDRSQFSRRQCVCRTERERDIRPPLSRHAMSARGTRSRRHVSRDEAICAKRSY
jgi:hypothetical protein